MSRTKAIPTKTVKRTSPSPQAGRIVGVDRTEKWRCNACTFLSEGEVCQTCGASKPSRVVRPAHGSKPNPNFKSAPKEEKKSEVYFDPVDGSMNVPIAGIKKYYPRKETEIRVPKVAPPKQKSNMMTIADLEAQAQSPAGAPRRPDGKRDLLGMLQDADHSDTLPMMRKKGSKK